MFSEIRLVTLGVGDLDRSIFFFADALGFEEISRTRVDPEALSEAWRIPAGVAGRFAIMGVPGVTSGMLRLVEWTPQGEAVWAPPGRYQDLGIHGVSFRARDVNATWDLLSRAGGREISKPTYWEAGQNLAAWTSRSGDPDGTQIEMLQLVGEIERTLGNFSSGREVTEVQAVTVHCADARRSEAFYTSLGFESLYDQVVDQVWDFFDLPRGARVHSIQLMMRGDRPTGRVELVQHIGVPSRSLKTRSAPPNRGPLMMSMGVTALGPASSLAKDLGAKPIGEARYDSPPFGAVNAATFFGPDDEVIEFFEIEG